MAAIPVPPVHQIALLQLVVALLASILLLMIDEMLAMSVLIGTMIQLIPQAFFNRAAFRYTGARQTAAILREFYKGESAKLVLTAVMFALAFKYGTGLSYPAVFISFASMIVSHGVFTARLLKPEKQI